LRYTAGCGPVTSGPYQRGAYRPRVDQRTPFRLEACCCILRIARL